MKRKLMTLVAIVATLSAWADDYSYLTFQSTDGTISSVAVESLTITVSNGKLLATNAAGTKTFTLKELSKMYFSSDPTGIESIENEKLRNGENEKIYNLSGQKMSNGQMKRGIYVIRQNGKTRKVVVK